MSFISIIIPFNKGKRYLKDCLDSLSEQNLEDEEVLLIINGSDEDVNDLIDSYKSELNITTKVFDNEIGVAKARNVGLDLASGKYVYFIDSDDYLYKNALSKLVSVAKKTDADLINGERITTSFIRDRVNEQFDRKDYTYITHKGLSDMRFSVKLLVGVKNNKLELLSSLHCLIKSEKIQNIRFDESKRYYSDYDFMLNVMDNIDDFKGVEHAVYAKRSRDDAVNLTSLNQEKKEHYFLSYYYEYENIIKFLESSNHLNKPQFKALKDEINSKLLSYYSKRFATQFLYSSNDIWREEYFDAMSNIASNFDIEKVPKKQKREIEALRNKNKKSLTRYLKFKAYFNKIKKFIKHPTKNHDLKLYRKVYNNRKIIENQIIFESFRGDYYSDSPKYLYEFLYENFNDKFKFVWVLNDDSVKIPGNPKTVKRFSREFYKEVARSKYWIINGRQAARLRKREEQIVISTWHGTPLKKLGLDMGNVYTEDPKIKASYVDVARKWDYLISPNHYTTEIYRSAFDYEGIIIEEGYPRNDILYKYTEDQCNQIKQKLNIPSDKKVLLYAPTWRDDEFFEIGKVNFKLQLDLDKLRKELGEEYVVLVRTHYFIADYLDLSEYENFAFDVCKYDDIAELYLISDILITDYSSVFFDFANLKKPILFYTYDLEKYENVLRGFYIDINSEVPGPLLKTTEEVIESIKNIDAINEEYSELYDEFYERFCSLEDGNSSERIVNKIINDVKCQESQL